MKSFCNKLTIKTRVLLLLILSCLFVLISATCGFYSTSKTTKCYQNLLNTAVERRVLTADFNAQMETVYEDMNALINVYNSNSSTSELKSQYEETKEAITKFHEYLTIYTENINNDITLTDEARKLLSDHRDIIVASLTEYESYLDAMYGAFRNNNEHKVEDCINEASAVKDVMADSVAILVQKALDRDAVLKEETLSFAQKMEVSVVIIGVIAMLITVLVGLVLVRSILKPINRLIDTANSVSQGDFSVEFEHNSNDELSLLSNAFENVITSFTSILTDMSKAFKEMENGNLEQRVDLSDLQGDYLVIGKEINRCIEGVLADLKQITTGIDAYASGDFNYECPHFPGDKEIIYTSFEHMRANMVNIHKNIKDIITHIDNGDLEFSISTEGLTNDWLSMINELNNLVEHIALPVRETTRALKDVSVGKLSTYVVEDRYKGEFFEIANAINTTVDTLKLYVSSISDTLQQMANKNLNINITTDYVGDFAPIKEALTYIVSNFNMLIGEMIMSSEQVSVGAQSIADQATSLAQGATEQASAIEELSSNLHTFEDKLKQTSDLIGSANQEANTAKQSAVEIAEQSEHLLEAMSAIETAANDISNIVNIIDGIAFQTNILALNAAVEAARAGDAGRGFSVVAEEVRNLATRSATAVADTEDLIKTAVGTSREGNDIAKQTTDKIREIIHKVNSISDISAKISTESEEQLASIKEMNAGLNQISSVVTTNTATSEESAAASQELASQSTVFQERISEFKIRKK